MSAPSRFDQHGDKLISGYASQFFEACLKPYSRYNVNIKLLDDHIKGGSKLLEGTKVVVLLGATAQRCYTPQYQLNQIRGYPTVRNGIAYIATYFPQDCIDRKNYETPQEIEGDDEKDHEEGKEKEHSKTRRKNFRFWFYQDIQKSLRILQQGVAQLHREAEYHVYPGANEVCTRLGELQGRTIYFDIETNENYRVTVFSFSTDHKHVWTVPVYRYNGEYAYNTLALAKIFAALSGSFTRNRVVIHNALYDLFILAWLYRIAPPLDVHDTMVMHHRLYPESEKSLGHVMSMRSNEPYHKDESCFNPKTREQEQQLWAYNGKDVFGLALIHQDILRESQELKLSDSVDIATRLVRPCLLQTLHGIRIDDQWRQEQLKELDSKKVQLRRIMRVLVGYDICKPSKDGDDEVLGWQRVAKYLYDYKRFPRPSPKVIDGKVVYRDLTSATTLYKLLLKYDIPFIKTLLLYRSLTKKSGFLNFQPWRGRLTSQDLPSGTDTFRLASRQVFGKWGTNKQNIEKALRRVCIADEGKTLLQKDQIGAEAVIVAYLCQRGNYRLMMEQGIKAHVYVALHVFSEVWRAKLKRDMGPYVFASLDKLTSIEGWPEVDALIKSSDNWPASERYYYIAKMICHASNYGMKAPTFQLNVLDKSEGTIVLGKRQAEYYLATYHALFPEIQSWHTEVRAQLAQDNTLYNLFGDRRIFYGNWGDDLFKKAYAFVPQSTVGMITNRCTIALQEMLDRGEHQEHGIDILANGHDAILVQCLEGHEHQVNDIITPLINVKFTVRPDSEFTMRSDCQVGHDWYNLKSLK